MLKKRTGLSVPQLTYYGALICLIAELIYQAIRKSVEGVDSLASGIHYFLLSTAGMTIMGTVFSFFVAFQLKTKKTGWLILFIFLFVLVVYEINYLYPVKNW
jgi:4-hydroxybenzoate polyprenyltransferase